MNRKHLAVIIFLLLTVFLFWVVSVLVPVIAVELTYQYRRTLHDVFGVSNIRALVMPQFRIDVKPKNAMDGISIPSLFIDEPVVYNVDPNDARAYKKALTQGIAHAAGTAFPGTGELGYYFAHSSSPGFVQQFNAVFYLLDKLKTGDTVTVWHDTKRFDYAVYEKRITAPLDVSFLSDHYEDETIVLQTCWPPGTTLERLLVFARLHPTLVP